MGNVTSTNATEGEKNNHNMKRNKNKQQQEEEGGKDGKEISTEINN